MRILLAGIVSACLIAACGQSAEPPAEMSVRLEADALGPDSSNEAIMLHMLETANGQGQTDQLQTYFPDLDRKRAYAIQRLRLEHGTQTAEHVGWKLAWTRQGEPGEELDPVVGHYLSDRVYPEGEPVSTRFFTGGVSNAEPEIVFYLKEDLPGPVVTREQLIAAVDAVGVGMEFVNWRTTEPGTREHAVADNGIAVGVILGAERHPLASVDFTQEIGRVEVRGKGSSEGPATVLMGEDPIAAMLWAANELPKWGMHFKAGQFVFSGTVCLPQQVSAGDSATVSFTNLGSVSASFVE
ncbi:MAG: hypothetical protein AAGA44_15540 [Pseudomonadota bacterium]